MESANDLVPSGAPVHFNGMETLCPPAAGRAYLPGMGPRSAKAGDESCNAAACRGADYQHGGRAKSESHDHSNHLGLLSLGLYILIYKDRKEDLKVRICAFRETRKYLYIRTSLRRAGLL